MQTVCAKKNTHSKRALNLAAVPAGTIITQPKRHMSVSAETSYVICAGGWDKKKEKKKEKIQINSIFKFL